MSRKMTFTHDSTICRYIRDLTAEYGYPPTVEELKERIGFSKTATFYHLRNQRGNLWNWQDGRARTLRLLPAGLRLAEGDGDA